MKEVNLLVVCLYLLSSIGLTVSLNRENRWKALLLTSLLAYFYMMDFKVFILIGLSFTIYCFALLIERKDYVVGMAVLILLTPLTVVKIAYSGSHFENFSLPKMDVTEPMYIISLFYLVGLSYFTFNGISYLVDVKRKYIVPERNFFLLLLYLTYFPTIFSGPLHRAKYLLREFKNIEVTNATFSKGLRLILWGLFKNLVVSKRLYALMIQMQSGQAEGLYYLLVGLIFFLYLYCNFSAFVDFFQGVSQIFNVKLKNNFGNRIYFAPSRQRFWKEWHMTLNDWFRDYFFFVIARHDKKKRYIDWILLITFVLIALWHELSIAMLMWGLLSGLWIVIERKIDLHKLPFPKIRRVFGVFYHLFFSSLIALIFISPDIVETFRILLIEESSFAINLTPTIKSVSVILLSFLIMDYHNSKSGKLRFDDYMAAKPMWLRWTIYFKLIFMILIFGMESGIDNYYIQF